VNRGSIDNKVFVVICIFFAEPRAKNPHTFFGIRQVARNTRSARSLRQSLTDLLAAIVEAYVRVESRGISMQFPHTLSVKMLSARGEKLTIRPALLIWIDLQVFSASVALPQESTFHKGHITRSEKAGTAFLLAPWK
jgi:hypothetical protein